MSEWQQVLINIINNAIDALDGINFDHKKIEISAKQEKKLIKIFHPRQWVWYKVRSRVENF
jgi:C4-dicarboxylate-specific signal transduction histidine kinase